MEKDMGQGAYSLRTGTEGPPNTTNSVRGPSVPV